jgi:hypothetical protein
MGTFRDHSGHIQGTFREHSGNIQLVITFMRFSQLFSLMAKHVMAAGTFREHSGTIRGTFRERSACDHLHEVLAAVLVDGEARDGGGEIVSDAPHLYLRVLRH